MAIDEITSTLCALFTSFVIFLIKCTVHFTLLKSILVCDCTVSATDFHSVSQIFPVTYALPRICYVKLSVNIIKLSIKYYYICTLFE